jgi:hypothetical protein
MIADVILEIFDALESDLQIVRQERHSLSQVLPIAREAASVLDACQLISSSLFSIPAEHCFHDLELPPDRSYNARSSFFYQSVRVVVEDRPFVYIVWNHQPRRFLYVGTCQFEEATARTSALEPRGKLLHALQQGSLATLICPRPMSASLANALQAALLSVFDSQRAYPDFNDRPRKAVRPLPSHLEEIGQLVDELGTRLEVPTPP